MSNTAQSNPMPIKTHISVHTSNLLSVTPPDRNNQLPPSPPDTTERLGKGTVKEEDDDNNLRLPGQLLRHKCQSSIGEVSEFKEFKLSPEQYHILESKIEEAFRCFDYDPQRSCLTIRMPSVTHDYFTIKLRDEICKELNGMAASCTGKIKEINESLDSAISSRVFLREMDQIEDLDEENEANEKKESSNKEVSDYRKYAIRREPDIQFQYPGTLYPGVVVEVSYSQSGKDLRKLAQDYVLYSNADVKLVIGINLSYKGGSSTVSTWRPKFIENRDGEDLVTAPDVQNRPFLSSDGQLQNPNDVLTIDLRDFATDEISNTWPDTKINIKFSRLAQLFKDAQQRQLEKESAESSKVLKTSRTTKKRRLPSSSPPRLGSDDEMKIREWEQNADEKGNKADADYVDGDATEDKRAVKRRG